MKLINNELGKNDIIHMLKYASVYAEFENIEVNIDRFINVYIKTDDFKYFDNDEEVSNIILFYSSYSGIMFIRLEFYRDLIKSPLVINFDNIQEIEITG